MIVAEGWFATFTRFTGNTVSDDGAMPNVHFSSAVFTTWIGIVVPPERMSDRIMRVRASDRK